METQEHIMLPQKVATSVSHGGIPKLRMAKPRNKAKRFFYDLRLYYHNKVYTETDVATHEACKFLVYRLAQCKGDVTPVRDKVLQEIQGYEYWTRYNTDPEDLERYKRKLSVYYDFMARTERS